jgi:hypothetical protein
LVGLLSPGDYAGYADEGRRLAVDVPNVTPMDAARFIAEAAPIIGDAMAAKEIYDEATSENPNWALVGALGGAAVLGLFPGIGDAAAKAVKSGARGLLDTAKRVEVDPSAMGSLLGNVRLKPKGDAGEAAKPSPAELAQEVAGFKAYHGSPHDFDKFSMDAIGTGEGAQVYGHGLYFAEAEDVAKKYRDDLAGWSTAGAQRTLESVGGDVDRAILETQQKLDRLLERNQTGAFKGAERNFNMQLQIQKDKIAQLEGFKATGEFNAGRIYDVNIAANPDDFLDWDVPVSQQSAKVQDAWSKFLGTKQAVRANMPRDQFQDPTGKDFLGAYSEAAPHNPNAPFDYQKKFSNVLKRKGIPGIKYLDAGSRGIASGTKNFVVFDEKLINIVKKYGVAGAATMLGVTAMDVEQAMAQGMQQPSGLLTPDMINSQQANQRPYNAGLLQ